MKIMSVMPAAAASSTAYWISGLSTTGSISFGLALVAGRKRVPRPATGKTALVIFFMVLFLIELPSTACASGLSELQEPASSSTGTPSSSAFASLLPASAPATT